VTQIADGENGGVMMNEFPAKYHQVVAECSRSEVPLVNVSEYLEYLSTLGIGEQDFPAVQPIFQHRLWQRMRPGDGPERLKQVIAELQKEDSRFHMEGRSWTNDISWVRGYQDVLGPMERASALFHEKVLKREVSSGEDRYRNALFHLMASQTSCYRYWGHGLWTDYGKEICRRTMDILNHDF
jgi:hypothetical protein